VGDIEFWVIFFHWKFNWTTKKIVLKGKNELGNQFTLGRNNIGYKSVYKWINACMHMYVWMMWGKSWLEFLSKESELQSH
jgi:hypothetical protein